MHSNISHEILLACEHICDIHIVCPNIGNNFEILPNPNQKFIRKPCRGVIIAISRHNVADTTPVQLNTIYW